MCVGTLGALPCFNTNVKSVHSDPFAKIKLGVEKVVLDMEAEFLG